MKRQYVSPLRRPMQVHSHFKLVAITCPQLMSHGQVVYLLTISMSLCA